MRASSMILLPLVAALPAVASLRGGSSRHTQETTTTSNNMVPQHPQHQHPSTPTQRQGRQQQKLEKQLRQQQRQQPHNTMPGVYGSDLQALNSNMADLWEPYDQHKDTAVFFMIPKSGTTTLEAYMSSCLRLVMANDIGGSFVSDQLEVVSFRDHPYVNVNTLHQDGVAHAAELDMGSKALADVMVTPYLHQSAEQLFSREHKGRMFTLMRHPIDRTVSLFYYLQTADWEPTYNPALKDISIVDFLNDRHLFVDNFMTRQLVGKSSRDVEVGEDDLEAAKSVLRQKMLVGLSTQFDASLARFSSYFGWDVDSGCLERLTSGGGRNRNSHPVLEEGSFEWRRVLHVNRFDVALFEYAERLFEQQAVLFESKAQS